MGPAQSVGTGIGRRAPRAREHCAPRPIRDRDALGSCRVRARRAERRKARPRRQGPSARSRTSASSRSKAGANSSIGVLRARLFPCAQRLRFRIGEADAPNPRAARAHGAATAGAAQARAPGARFLPTERRPPPPDRQAGPRSAAHGEALQASRAALRVPRVPAEGSIVSSSQSSSAMRLIEVAQFGDLRAQRLRRRLGAGRWDASESAIRSGLPLPAPRQARRAARH